jgi:DNA polymerase I-like protein with 3'-5' exonuclease and polymerase domains
MILHYLMFPELPKSLGFLTTLYTNHPYYKDDGKKDTDGKKSWQFDDDYVPSQKFFRYNALDAIIAHEIWLKLLEQPDYQDHEPTFIRTIELVGPLLDMECSGITFLADQALTVASDRAEGASKVLERLQATAPDLNPYSPKQLQEHFYSPAFRGVPTILNKKGKPCMDAIALNRIANLKQNKYALAAQEAALIIRYKDLASSSTKTTNLKYIHGNRVTTDWKLRGTKFGRLSSAKNIFGEGRNLQNLSADESSLFVADEGYTFVEADLAGAEWVIVAHLARDPNMLEVIASGKSPHTYTASLLFDLPFECVEQEEKDMEGCIDAAELKAYRLAHGLPTTGVPTSITLRKGAKISNHGFNYGLGPKSFSIQNNLTLADAKTLYEGYHNAYKGIKSTFHCEAFWNVRNHGYLTNLLGRKIRFLEDFRWSDKPSDDVLACVPQSTVFDITAIAMNKIKMWSKYAKFTIHGHDSLLYSVPNDQVANFAHLVRAAMHVPLKVSGGNEFVLGCDVKAGKTRNKKQMKPA